MEIGIISDVHSNAAALRSVMKELDDRGVSDIICAGDIVGYYSSPNDVISIFNERGIKAVRGNHDEAVIKGTPNGYRDTAKVSLEWTRENIGPNELNYLKSLPTELTFEVGGIEIFVTHGSPERPLTQYIYEEDIDQDFLSYHFGSHPPDIVVLGHTHRSYTVETDSTFVINPGSIGQPRDGHPSASYAIVNTSEATVSRYRCEYDIDETIRRIEQASLPKELGERLQEGR